MDESCALKSATSPSNVSILEFASAKSATTSSYKLLSTTSGKSFLFLTSSSTLISIDFLISSSTYLGSSKKATDSPSLPSLQGGFVEFLVQKT